MKEGFYKDAEGVLKIADIDRCSCGVLYSVNAMRVTQIGWKPELIQEDIDEDHFPYQCEDESL